MRKYRRSIMSVPRLNQEKILRARGRTIHASLLICFLLMAAAIAPATAGATPPRHHARAKTTTVDVVVGNVANGFYVAAARGAKAEARKLGVQVDFAGPTDFTQPSETDTLNTLLASSPSGLVVAPVDPSAIVPALRPWVKAHIPIATFDSTVSGPIPVVSRVATLNFASGVEAAQNLASLIGGSGEVATIGLNTSDLVLLHREQGFLDELRADFPNIEVVAQELTGSVSSSIPESQAESLITKYPHLKALFCTYNTATESAALGVEQVGDKGKVLVVGYDGDQKMFDLVRSGAIQVLIQQRPAQEAALAVEDVVRAARGETKDVSPTFNFPDVVVTKANVDRMSAYAY
jgi:ribose transport system substrate-binding protein